MNDLLKEPEVVLQHADYIITQLLTAYETLAGDIVTLETMTAEELYQGKGDPWVVDAYTTKEFCGHGQGDGCLESCEKALMDAIMNANNKLQRLLEAINKLMTGLKDLAALEGAINNSIEETNKKYFG